MSQGYTHEVVSQGYTHEVVSLGYTVGVPGSLHVYRTACTPLLHPVRTPLITVLHLESTGIRVIFSVLKKVTWRAELPETLITRHNDQLIAHQESLFLSVLECQDLLREAQNTVVDYSTPEQHRIFSTAWSTFLPCFGKRCKTGMI